MPRAPKLFLRGYLVEVCSRIQEGLPLVPNELNCLIIGSIMARAQTLYPVTIVAYSFVSNHFHMLLRVDNPENISKFICYLKRESAHAINTMLGRRQHTVWCERFDSPIVLDAAMAIERLNYVYLNPVEAGLCERVTDWPFSSASWVDFRKGESIKRFKPIPRRNVPVLPEEPLTSREVLDLCKELQDLPGEYFNLKIQPHAWSDCYSETVTGDPRSLHEFVFNKIRHEEERLKSEREKEGKLCPKLSDLKRQDMRKEYKPTKFGKRMSCLASEKAVRIEFLKWLKERFKQLPCYLKKQGKDYLKTMHYPPGFFAPGGFLSANILPMHTPLSFLS